MAAVHEEMLNLLFGNLDLDEDFEISSKISIDEEKPGFILQEDDIFSFNSSLMQIIFWE